MARFACPSFHLDLKRLVGAHRVLGPASLGLALSVHLALAQLARQGDQKVASRPLTTRFVKRAPRLTKPLEMKRIPAPRQRRIQRTMVSVQAKVARGADLSILRPVGLVQGLARPKARVSRGTSFLSAAAEPEAIAHSIEGSKEAKSAVDMSLEMLDIEALNTGRYHALVVQDPADRRNLKGFCRLSWLYIPRLHDRAIARTVGRGTTWAEHYVGGCIRLLAQAMNQYTSVDTYVGKRITINDREAFRIPWIFHVYFYQGYQLSDRELETLGRYLMGGGFIFADAHPLKEWSVASSHVNNLLGALETQGVHARFSKLPSVHPIFHCYFDFAMPPPGSEAWADKFPQYTPERVEYLEGLEVENRLVAILSRKGYYSCWCEWGPHAVRSGWADLDPTRQFQFGVNLIVFALTQEGSITSRVMDSFRGY